jgi:Tol biopolymer transport system component
VGGSTLRAIALALLGLLAFAPLAHATFPGQNGKIAYYTSWVGPHTSYVPPDVYTINSDGSGHARLTADERSGSPIWSPDGMKIVFGSDRDEPSDLDGELYAMNADGSQQTNLTNSPHTDREPAWSPDGRKIVFVSLRDEPSLYSCSPCNSEIYSMSADGSGVTRLTNSPGPDITPSWSPDGTRIVFSSKRDGNWEIYTMNADGSGVSRITQDPWDDEQPLWSPRGDEISFERTDPAEYYYRPQVFITRTDGTGERQLYTGSQYHVGGAAWSPDGRKISFETYNGAFQINIVNADGSGHIALTNDQPPPDYFIAISNAGPTWSPDGTKIAFTHQECPDYCGFSELETINADGTARETISGNAVAAPDWQPLVGPQRADYRNASHFCKALREFLGDEDFRNRYGGGANAHGKCVSGDRR